MELLEKIAKEFNGRRIGDEIRRWKNGNDADSLKEQGIVIVYGASDDLLELDGAISDECGANTGDVIYLHGCGIFDGNNDDVQQEWGTRGIGSIKEKCATIKPTYNDNGHWSYETAIPHATFEIMEDGEVYCVGLLFYVKDLPVIAELAK